MKTIKAAEATNIQLDWLVAKCEGATDLRHDTVACWWFTLNGQDRVLSSGWSMAQNWYPSTGWAQGGPIIEAMRERGVVWLEAKDHGCQCSLLPRDSGRGKNFHAVGLTPLIAAMRCFVASKLGNEVEIPEELL